MKKIILFLSLMAAFAVGGTALASSASAASCNIVVGNTYYGSGVWNSDSTLFNCSGVNGVQFAGSGGPGPNGIYANAPFAGWHPTFTVNGQNLSILTSYTYTQRVEVFGYGCGSPPFYVQWVVHYRLRNAFGSTWGSWHSATGAWHEIC